MRQVQPIPYPREIVHPQCDKCRVPMWLARIAPEPGAPDHDRRTFECPVCKAEMTEIVEYK